MSTQYTRNGARFDGLIAERDTLRDENEGLRLALAVLLDWIGGQAEIEHQELAVMSLSGRSLEMFEVELESKVVLRVRPPGVVLRVRPPGT